MSLRAVVWALQDAPIPKNEPIAHLVLIALADHAHEDGTAAWPSRSEIASAARCSIATVRRKLALLADAGLIVPGDDRIVAHIRPDRRPKVWDLALWITRETLPDGGSLCTPAPLESIHPRYDGGSHGGSHGGSLLTHKPVEPIEPIGESTYVSTDSAREPVDNSPDGESEVGASAPDPRTCPKHQGNPCPPPCHECKKARETWEQNTLEAAKQRRREQRRKARQREKDELARLRAAAVPPPKDLAQRFSRRKRA